MNRRSMLLLGSVALLPGGLAAAIERVRVQIDGAPPFDVVRALPVYRGLRCVVTISGKGVEECRRVEVGPDIPSPEGETRRSPGQLVFTLVPSPSAGLGERELRLRYAVEISGPERFPVRVLRNGEVFSVEPRKVPARVPVTLTFTGRDLGNADVLAQAAFRDARVLPGGTESRVQVQLVFAREGRFEVPLYDAAGVPRPGSSLRDPGGYLRRPESFVEVVPQ